MRPAVGETATSSCRLRSTRCKHGRYAHPFPAHRHLHPTAAGKPRSVRIKSADPASAASIRTISPPRRSRDAVAGRGRFGASSNRRHGRHIAERSSRPAVTRRRAARLIPPPRSTVYHPSHLPHGPMRSRGRRAAEGPGFLGYVLIDASIMPAWCPATPTLRPS